MNSGIFTPKIVYKCEENYRNKKKEYDDAIKKYKYLINELQQWQKTYKHNMKIYKSGPVNFKVNDIDFIDTAQIKSIVYNNPELIKAGILDKFKNFAKKSEPIVQECNPKYIAELTELEKRYKYLKETYETMYAETKKLQEESKKAAEEWRNKKEMKSKNDDNNNFRNNNDNNNNFKNNNFRNNNDNFKNNNDFDF